ncbi:hypothetical protein ELS19_07130 [Halogeometricum borinquense]|uniref:Uncharacterized protein n=1 Tax=Halogeometricum borinquense TaxID=60847 RepID=A0A482TA69_9EURY|nr:hypothetical protein [Halogeometricum borinquense]RYJ13757.1 hypothetical protein ELS19_07130 [Halogeometricum borinquense]
MPLIEFNFGRERTDDTADTGKEQVEIPIDDGSSSKSSSTGRKLLRTTVLLALVAAAGYLLYRRATAADDSEFAEIVFEDETAEAGTESTDE